MSGLLARDQQQGQQALAAAVTATAQGIATARNFAAQQKTALSLAVTAQGWQIQSDQSRLENEAAVETQDAATLEAGETVQARNSVLKVRMNELRWPEQFQKASTAELAVYLNQISEASTEIRLTLAPFHNALNLISLGSYFFGVPGQLVGRAADAINAVLYAAEGSYIQASLSAISAVPLVGKLFSTALEAERVGADLSGEAGQIARGLESAGTLGNAGADAEVADSVLTTAESEAGAAKSTIAPEVAEAENAGTTVCEQGGPAGTGGCFVAGTEVEMADGSEEPIQDIKDGDDVESRDQFDPNGPAQGETVTALYVHTAFDLRAVTIAGANGSTETIQSTDEHPYYVQNVGFVGAADLVPGDKLEEPDGSWATVTGNVDEPEPQGVRVYNFQVDADHTYFVSQGGAWVWVHNVCPSATYTGLNANRQLIRGQGVYVLRDAETGQIFKVGSSTDLYERFGAYRRIETAIAKQLTADIYYTKVRGSFEFETSLRNTLEQTNGALLWDGSGRRAALMGFAPGQFKLERLIQSDANFGRWGWSIPI